MTKKWDAWISTNVWKSPPAKSDKPVAICTESICANAEEGTISTKKQVSILITIKLSYANECGHRSSLIKLDIRLCVSKFPLKMNSLTFESYSRDL